METRWGRESLPPIAPVCGEECLVTGTSLDKKYLGHFTELFREREERVG